MLKIIVFALVLAAITLSGVMSVASAETVPSPLQQVRDGVPTGEIVCSENRALILSPSGIPACVFEEFVLELETRGFEFIGEPFDMFPIKSTDMPGVQDDGQLTRDPTLSMSTLPEIGETAIVEITYTNLFANLTAEEIASGHDDFKIGWTVGAGF